MARVETVENPAAKKKPNPESSTARSKAARAAAARKTPAQRRAIALKAARTRAANKHGGHPPKKRNPGTALATVPRKPNPSHGGGGSMLAEHDSLGWRELRTAGGALAGAAVGGGAAIGVEAWGPSTPLVRGLAVAGGSLALGLGVGLLSPSTGAGIAAAGMAGGAAIAMIGKPKKPAAGSTPSAGALPSRRPNAADVAAMHPIGAVVADVGAVVADVGAVNDWRRFGINPLTGELRRIY